MKINEILAEAWSQKYKRSINCSHPKGFSQRAHCAGKKKHNESIEMEMVCEDCGMCETHGDNLLEIKQRLDAKCWKGKHKEGTKIKGGIRVNNCVPNESLEEYGDTAKGQKMLTKVQKRAVDRAIKADDKRDPKAAKKNADTANRAWERMTDKDLEESEEKRCMQCGMKNCKCPGDSCKCKPIAGWEPGKGFKKAMDEAAEKKGMSRAAKGHEKYGKEGMQALAKAGQDGASEEKMDKIRDKYDRYDESMTPDEQFDMIEDMVESLAQASGIDAEQIWEDLESFDDETLLAESAAWRRSAGKSKKGGLNRKGVASYRREHPGSKLQMAVTTKPSKLKPGSKAAKRRKSFCARMGGVKGPMKKPNGKPTRKALALRKWHC